MNIIWAPWRKKYVLSKPKGCIFCKRPKGKPGYVISRTKHSFSMLNVFPYNNGHIMVSPKRHVKDLSLLSADELMDLMNLVVSSTKILSNVLKPHGYNIGLNLGKVAGAGYDGHLHFHIVPRWSGDTNFMPVVSDTKVIPESLDKLYGRLKIAADKKPGK